RGEPQGDDVAEEAAREVEALVDLEASVEEGIVDEALPADRGARLLEVGAHYDEELVAVSVTELGEPIRVVERGDRVVHRAGADHDDEAIVPTVHDVRDLPAGADDEFFALGVERELLDEDRRGDEGTDVIDVDVVGAADHREGLLPSLGRARESSAFRVLSPRCRAAHPLPRGTTSS